MEIQMRKRLKLVEARARKDWTLQEAAGWIGCAPNTLNRWELGTMNPSAYYRTRLSAAYGMRKDELGLEDERIVDLPERAASSALEHLRADFTMYLISLALAEYDTCWQVQDVLTRAIEEAAMISNNEVLRQKKEALQRLAMLPLFTRGQRSAEDIVNICAAGLTACGYLAISDHDDMQLASSMIGAYTPLLQAITVDSSKHQKAAAALLSQAMQIKARIGYHLEGVKQATMYAERSVEWAKKSQHKTMLIMAQREVLGAYEWTAMQNRGEALLIVEEVKQMMELKRATRMAPMIQSWVYTGLAKYQALNKQEDEMKVSLEKAEETFFAAPDTNFVPIYITHSHARLMRHKAISYAYLGQQEKALHIFADVVDLSNTAFAARLPMADRTYLGVLSEAMFSSLKVSPAKKDKDLSLALWMKSLQRAIALRSETYFNEASVAFQVMEGIWSDDTRVLGLRDALIHW
jgi:transcriptional regulator with XRE-family HTH domain